MKRLYTMMAVPLAAGLLFISGCSDDNEPPPQPVNTATRTVGGGNTPTATVPAVATATRTTAATVAPTNTVPPASPTHTATEGPTTAATDTPTEGPTVAATDTPTEGPTAEATPTVTPGGAGAICGNGVTEGPPAAGETCDDGNNWGGDGCAANCTTEPSTDLRLEFGTEESSQSQAVVQAQSFSLALKISGSQLTTPGTPRTDASVGADGFTNFAPGFAPVTNSVDKNAGRIDPIKVPGLVCACLRGIELQTCGGRPVDPGVTDTVCNNDAFGGIDPDICPPEDPCKPAFGPGQSAAGSFGCQGASNLNYLFTADHATGEVTFTSSGDPVAFGGQLRAYSAIGTIMDSGTCSEDTGNEAKGPDGIPCTDDDPAASRGTPQVQVQTTGTATAFVLNVNGASGKNIDNVSNCGALPCQTTATGVPKDCSELLQGHTEGLCLASAFGALSQPTTGDIVVPTKFCALTPQ